MTKKIAAALIVFALVGLGVGWLMLAVGPDDGDSVIAPTSRPIDPMAEGDDAPRKSEDAIGVNAPIGTVRYREAPLGGSGSKATAAALTARLIGRVVDEEQTPVAGASVRMKLSRQDSRDGTESREERDDLDVLTDTDGRFTFTHVPVGFEARLRARRADLCDTTLEVNVDRARTIDVGEMVAHGGGSVAGRVTAPDDVRIDTAKVMAWKTPDGGARPGALIFSRPNPRSARTVAVAADGTFRVDGLGPGEWILAAQIAGFPRSVRKPTTVTRGEVAWDADISIVDGASILGQVLDVEGRVVDGAKIRFRQDDGSMAQLIDQSSTAETRTGTDGRFRLRGLSPHPGRLRVVFDGHRTAQVDQLAPGDDELLIRLQPSALIHGIVLTPDGKPPEAFEAVPAVKTRFGTQSTGRMKVMYGDDAARAAGVESQPGLFAITQVPDLDVVLLIRSSGFSDEVAGPFRIAAGARESLSIQLKLEKVVAGIVHDPAGRPVHGARVRARAPGASAAGTPPGSRRVERRVVRRRGGPAGASEPGVPSVSDEPEAIFDLSSGAYGDFTFGVNAVPTAGAQITMTYIVDASSSTENPL